MLVEVTWLQSWRQLHIEIILRLLLLFQLPDVCLLCLVLHSQLLQFHLLLTFILLFLFFQLLHFAQKFSVLLSCRQCRDVYDHDIDLTPEIEQRQLLILAFLTPEIQFLLL